jgi:hypothetical protein
MNDIGTYSYIEIGDQVIKKPKAWTGMQGELRNAIGQDATLHMSGPYVVGLTNAEGRTFACAGDGFMD